MLNKVKFVFRLDKYNKVGEKMLVSAVITTHKRPPELVERALNSVLQQTYKEIEVTVVDDSPADYEFRPAVKDMVESYQSSGARYIAHEKCKGACAARNTGMAASNGEFIGFLDDDDEWFPNKIEEQLKGFDSDDIALVYCGSITRYDATGEEKVRAIPHKKGNIYKDLLRTNYIGSTSFPLIRMSMLKEIGGFDVEMQSAQDYDVWLRLAKKHAVNFVDMPLVRYHFHEGEQITKNPGKKIAGVERIIYKNREAIKGDKQLVWKYCTLLVPWYTKNKQYRKALGAWFKAVFKCPWKFKANLTYLYSFFRILFESKAKQ